MFAQRIKDMCIEQGITVAELERNAGLPKSTISNWSRKENPSVPSATTLLKVAKALGTTVEVLIEGVE